MRDSDFLLNVQALISKFGELGVLQGLAKKNSDHIIRGAVLYPNFLEFNTFSNKEVANVNVVGASAARCPAVVSEPDFSLITWYP